MRAQQASKDGLRDRARLKGLPACGKAPFGYAWTPDRKRLTPNERYEDAKRISDMARGGMSMRSIAFALVGAGIPSSKGNPTWHVSIIHNILNNPTYCGEYYALRMAVRDPKKRRNGDSYGKTSWRITDPAAWIRLPVEVELPIVTRPEFDAIQERLTQNKALAKRNTKYFYLLRGMVRCMESNHSCLVTRRRDGYYQYACPLRQKAWVAGKTCDNRRIFGPTLENQVWAAISDFLIHPETVLQAVQERQEKEAGTEETLRVAIEGLEKTAKKLVEGEASLAMQLALGKLSQDAYDIARGQLESQRKSINEDRQRIELKLRSHQDIILTTEKVALIRNRVEDKLETASSEEKRWVLEMLVLSQPNCWQDRDGEA